MKFFLLILAILPFCCSSPEVHHLSNDYIRSINNKQNTWKADRNFPEDTPPEYLRRLAGTLKDSEEKNFTVKFHSLITSLPESFDAREHWPQCKSLNNIRNQESCGSCWAFSTVESITDRLCIASNGATKFQFSAEDLLTCCEACGSCDGGYTQSAFQYWINTGIVSGGDYKSNSGCQPYSDESRQGKNLECSTTCRNKKYCKSYSTDKHYGKTYYKINNDEEQIRAEILQNGPVVAIFDVYYDFYFYSSGVYIHTAGNKTGSHAVKIIGWGTENGKPYWLIANSWGSNWGALGGFFKFLRGYNHLQIEQWIYAGLPKL